MIHRSKHERGFTIVELLIVVVVIAILAAVTIVAYNGINDRAKKSAAQAASSQATKKIAAFAATNSDLFPTSAELDAAIGQTTTPGVTYQYTVATDQKSYCLTTTSNGSSYFTAHNATQPQYGGCPGHDANGQTAITNLVPNPNFETSAFNAQNIGNATGRTVGRTSIGDAFDGGYVFRINQPTAGISLGGYGVLTASVPTGSYVASLWVRSNQSIPVLVYLEGSASKTPGSGGGVTLTANTWRRIQLPITVNTAGTVKVGFLVSGNAPVANTYVDMDGVMLTSGSTVYTFADGTSSNWVWTGTVHESTSMGIPLP